MGDQGRIRRRIVTLAGLVPLLVGLPAHAQGRDYGPFDTIGLGLFVGYTFGKERGVDWGIEAFGTRLEEADICGNNSERGGVGPLLRLSALNVSRVSLTGAVHLGGELSRSLVAADLELGGTLAYADGDAFGSFHTGVALESLVFNAYARQEWNLRSYTVGAGARIMPTFGMPGFCAVGRAFRSDEGLPQSCRSEAARDFDARAPEATLWAERAGDECSSVLAFLQLALELVDVGAPLELAVRAVRAAEQELTHTWAASALARRFGEAPLVARSPKPCFRPALPRQQQLARLARESFADGCLNEGLAALVATAEARKSRDSVEARISAAIALDEAEHAALAFDVVRWITTEDATLTPERAAASEGSVRSPLGAASVRELAALQTAATSTWLRDPSGPSPQLAI